MLLDDWQILISCCHCFQFGLVFVQVPRNGGIKKGWVREYMVVCDFKLFLYEIPADRNHPSQVVQQVIDMRFVALVFYQPHQDFTVCFLNIALAKR